MPVVSHASPNGVFCIDCNHCGRSIPNEHYHCSICDDGDYDLCLQCVEAGVACLDDEHWLIKRLVKDGQVTNSTTETVQPRKAREEPEPEEEEEETFEESVPELVSEATPVPPVAAPELPESTQERICNDCLKGMFYPSIELITID